MNRDADAIRAGGVAAARILRKRNWRHEADDVRQDGVLGALEALRRNPMAPFPYLVAAGTNRILTERLGRQVGGVRQRDEYADASTQPDTMYDPWPQVDAVITLVELSGDLTPRERRAIIEEGGGRSDPAHYQAHKRAIWRMREKACA